MAEKLRPNETLTRLRDLDEQFHILLKEQSAMNISAI